MERAELINHMEHLAEYVKYSEDAPALREIIEMLKTHEEHTETHACDSVNRQSAIDAINSHFGFNIEEEYGSAVQEVINALPPVQPDHIADVSKKVDADLINRADVEQTVEDNILCYTHSDRPIDQDPDTEYHKAIRTALKMLRKDLRKLPSAQPESTMGQQTKTFQSTNDLISRQTVRQKLTALVNELEKIFSVIRERNVDDSVCGLCEYDGAYIGQSGDWCNECPGFDRDDCFKLKEKYREEWLKIDGAERREE